MTSLELSHADLELPFGIKFLYQSYLNLSKRTKKPDNLILIFKRDFVALQNQLAQADAINKEALRYQKSLFDSQLQAVKAEFMKTLSEKPQIVDVPVDVRKTK